MFKKLTFKYQVYMDFSKTVHVEIVNNNGKTDRIQEKMEGVGKLSQSQGLRGLAESTMGSPEGNGHET